MVDQMGNPGTVPSWEPQGSEVPGKGQWGWRVRFSTDTGSRNETTARLVPVLASGFPQEEVEPWDRSNDVPWD